MAGIDNALMFDVLKAIQARVEQIDGKADENKQDMQALRTQMLGIHHDLISIHQELGGIPATLVRHEQRLSPIERGLELTDAPSL